MNPLFSTDLHSRVCYSRLRVYVASLLLFAITLAEAWAQGSPTAIYVTDSGRIFKFNAAGNRTLFASGLNNATGLAVDSAGNLYAADDNGIASAIYKDDPSGAVTLFPNDGDLAQPRGLAIR